MKVIPKNHDFLIVKRPVKNRLDIIGEIVIYQF